MIVITACAALILSIPDWGRWTLAGTAVAGISALGIAVLIGPAARRLAGERHSLTQAERQQMTATERVEAVNAARHTLIQAATGLVVIGGVIFTGQGLWYTAQSLDASRQAQRTAEQGQIADRYTKEVEQIGSGTLDVRLGGMYALERLAKDSPRDHQTVYDVLAAFIREHDPQLSVKAKKLPAQPATDVQAALTIIGRRNTRLDADKPDLNNIRTPGAHLNGAHLYGANLYGANLTRAYLSGVELTRADLNRADLTGAYLTFAHLARANLSAAKLAGAYLTGADLTGASLYGADLDGADLISAHLYGTDLTNAHLWGAYLTGADLRRAYLTRAYLYGADLRRTDLTRANLARADLRRANLARANLYGADLTGADLRGIRGMTEKEIRLLATVDDKTTF